MTVALRIALILLLLLALGPAVRFAMIQVRGYPGWWEANHDSAGISPLPGEFNEGIVQVFAARVYGWRGAFAVHTWIAAKPTGARHYVRYEKIGWRSGNKVFRNPGVPDARWYGAEPELIWEMRGKGADAVIRKINAAADSYPLAWHYRAWPGPNSNSFVAWIMRRVPEIDAPLPPTAIGMDFLPEDRWFSMTPDGRGFQVAIQGVIGLAVGIDVGIELNILGLVIGVDFTRPAIKLPGFGRIGMSR